MKVRIATRRSPLALWQANHVAMMLATLGAVEHELVAIDTSPDLDLSQPIADIGGKGAFSKEVQTLVLAGAADIAVHSAKDLQAVTPDGLVVGAFPERGAMADCLVGSRLMDLAPGAVVATGSNRRRSLLLDIRPDLEIVGLRGNIGTRLQKLDDPGIDAIVVARAALDRLGERPDLVEDLDVETFIPQVGQGSLAVECRADDTPLLDLLAQIDHQPTRTTVSAERDFLLELGGDCDLPAGANAALGSDGKLTIRGVLAEPPEAGGRLQRADVVELPQAVPGRILAKRLRAVATPGS